MNINDQKGTLNLVWKDVYELNLCVLRFSLFLNAYICVNRKTGEWSSPQGKAYSVKDHATVKGNVTLQEAVGSALLHHSPLIHIPELR
jgi:hypothetical protein